MAIPGVYMSLLIYIASTRYGKYRVYILPCFYTYIVLVGVTRFQRNRLVNPAVSSSEVPRASHWLGCNRS